MWIQAILAFSNILGWFVLLKKNVDDLTSTIVTICMSASAAMHLSETKHGLHAVFPFNDSDAFTWLMLDRVAAFVAFFYFLALLAARIKMGEVTDDLFVSILIQGFLGICCMVLGELVSNQVLYLCLHLVWHFSAYSIMYHLA